MLDKALALSVPAAAAIFFFALGLVHSAGPRLSYVVSGLLAGSFASFALLPILIVINVLFNKERTSMRMLWLQSILAGIWACCGSAVTWATYERLGESALWVALLTGALLAATPIVPARQRSRKS
jgi:hypothetical protein